MDDVVLLHPVTLRFRDGALEREFLDELARRSLKQNRISSLATYALTMLVLYPWAAIVVPEVKGLVLLVVATTMVPPSLAYLALTYAPFPVFRAHWQWLGAATNGAFGLAIVVLQAVEPEAARPHAYVGLLLVNVFAHALWGERFIYATVSTWTNTLLYFVVTAFIAPLAAVDCGNNVFWIAIATLVSMLVSRYLETSWRTEFQQARLLAAERAKSERLLLNVLPETIAKRLKNDAAAIADRFECVTVLFGDLVHFTELAERLAPERLVAILNRAFTAFDDIASRHGLEKIKTIGDAYMVAGGLPIPREDHAAAIADMALEMQRAVAAIGADLELPLEMRIGIHSGPVVAGVIGKSKFIYDLWGDTVNTASRMESHGVAGAIHVSATTHALLRDAYELEARGSIEVKGKGAMQTFFLGARKLVTAAA